MIFLAKGDVALSVTISSVSTLVGVIATPLLTRLYVDAHIQVDVMGMLLSILQIVVIPIALGLVIHHLFPRVVKAVEPYLPAFSMVCILAIISAVVAGSASHIASVGFVVIVAVVALLGLAAGFALGKMRGQASARMAKASEVDALRGSCEAMKDDNARLAAQVAQAKAQSEGLLQQLSFAKSQLAQAQQAEQVRVQRERERAEADGLRRREEQEKALTNLFTGIRAKEVSDYEVTIVPFDNLDKEVLFRFSPQLGIVDADDLGGAPVYMNLKAIDRAPVLDPKEAEKKEKSLKGIIYNVPGKASIEISMNKKTLYKGEAQITQFGTREGLAPIMFEDKKAPVKVYFYPETGAIKQIIQ